MLQNQVFLLFLVFTLGYALGRIRIRGVTLGTAGILIVALVFGHFGCELVSFVQNIGLVGFVTAVGFIAGPGFFKIFFGKAKAFIIIGVSIIVSACLTCLLIIWLTRMSAPLGLGLLTGSLTTTPGLAAAIESTGSDVVSVGYGIAYPFGVISVVIFVQILPKLMHIDLEKEKQKLREQIKSEPKALPANLISIDAHGLFPFALAVVLGLLIASIKIPLPKGGEFSLGTSGGPLFAGILLGYFQRIWRFDFRIRKETLVTIREIGLAFFLAGAGMKAGKGFVEVLMQNGPILFFYGALMAIVPLLVGTLVARKLFKLDMLDSLGSICGGMTSTPALGALISSSGTDDVTSSYAATYPAALATIVLLVEIIGSYMA